MTPPKPLNLPLIALALPFAAVGLFWLIFTNPLTLKYSEWGYFFWLALMLGGAGVAGAILAFKSLTSGGALAWAALVINVLAVLFALATLSG